MRRHVTFGLGLVLALLSPACLQPSLNPLLLPADMNFDVRLVGWKSGDTTWTFSKAADKDAQAVFDGRPFYEVTLTEMNETVKVWAWIGRLGDAQFINFFPDDPPVEIKSGFYKRHLVAAYTFGRIWIENDLIRLGMLNADWVKKATGEGKLALGPKRWPDDEVVLLTASTLELQRFAREHANDDKAFGDRTELIRQK